MAGKTPGTPRKSTSSKKTSVKKGPTVTPIDATTVPETDAADASSIAANTSSTMNAPVPAPNTAGTNATVTPISQNSPQISQNSPQNGNMGSSEGASRTAEMPHRLGDRDLVEQIRARAYELFEQRGRREGFDQQDWAQAEAEVLAKFQREKSA